jgi:hypothetical protein
MSVDKTLQLDLEMLPTKYIALCEFTGNLLNKSAKDIDEQVDLFLRLTQFEVSETPIDAEELKKFLDEEEGRWSHIDKLNG